jgi:hypothetical protein
MKKLIANFCAFSFALNVFTATGTTAAFASEVSSSTNKQEIIADIFAQYSMTMEKAEGQVKALSEASTAIKENNISNDELVAFAVADMNPTEAKSFLSNAAQLNSKNLSTEEAAKIVLNSQGQGSNFMACAFGDAGVTVALIAGIGAFAIGLIAMENLGYSTKSERNEIKLARVETEEEITILLGEGVSESSYLITSRRADVAYMNEQERQLEEEQVDKRNEGKIQGAATAALILLTVINLGC